MSKRPIRVTGFTRFFIVMLLVAPLAYIGASFYNGEDGVEKIKNLLKLNKTESVTKSSQPEPESETLRVNEAPSTQALVEENKKLKDELDFKNKRNDELYREIDELKRKLQSAEKALEEAKPK